MWKEILEKIGIHPKKPLSLDQVRNIHEQVAKKQDFLGEAKKKDKPITTVDPAIVGRDLHRIIDHFIPSFGQWRQVKTLMKLRVNGASIQRIAFAFNVPKHLVISLENMGKDKIKKGISRDPEYYVPDKNAGPKSRLVYPGGGL